MAKQWHQLEHLDHKQLKKLQSEREKAAKLAQQAEARKKQMMIGGAVLIVVAVVCALGLIMRNKAIERAYNEEREKLLFSKVTDYSGDVQVRKTGMWSPLNENLNFKEEHSFRANEESNVTVQLQLEYQVKLFADTEAPVRPPVLEKKENKIVKQIVELQKGQVTCAVSLDGRNIMSVQIANIVIVGQSGLFKVIYDEDGDKGEVVVKNGLVEVSRNDDKSSKPIKLSGFYKVSFEGGELSSPTQASVIQYDWR